MDNDLFDGDSCTSFHLLRGNELEDVLIEILNCDLSYRDTLNLPNRVTFGTEIEYEGLSRNVVEKYLDRYHSEWESKIDSSLHSGGEINSPILRDIKSSWDELEDICSFLDKKKVDTSRNAGGHIHVGSNILDFDIDNWKLFLELYLNYESVLFRFFYGDKLNARPKIKKYAYPIADLIRSKWDKIEDTENLSELKSIIIGNSKFNAVNFHNTKFYVSYCDFYKNTIEFRSPNSSSNEIVWQNNINAICKMLLSCREDIIEKDFLDFKMNKDYLSYSDNPYIYNSINLVNALEFVDMIFDNNLDKVYFLKQYLKDFEEIHNVDNRAIMSKCLIKKGK